MQPRTRMILQQYTKKGLFLFLLIMPLHTLLINFLIFGSLLFSSLSLFLTAYPITFAVIGTLWLVHDRVSVILKERLPHERDYMRQFGLKICFFILIKSLTLHFLFTGYTLLFDVHLPQANYILLLLIANVINVLTTTLHEGAVGFDKWKATLVETEKLKRDYAQSQLWNLQSQLNPHFLFNNLNTLSSLIEEDEKEAEAYLDELSKVYRYLLRHNEETLVPLIDEIKFLHSYFYVLQARYGTALQTRIAVDDEAAKKLIPPLSLQALVESTLTQFELSKVQPLKLELTLKGVFLQVKNNMQKKGGVDRQAETQKFETLIRKFELLSHQPVIVREVENTRTILLPLAQSN